MEYNLSFQCYKLVYELNKVGKNTGYKSVQLRDSALTDKTVAYMSDQYREAAILAMECEDDNMRQKVEVLGVLVK